MSRLFRIQAATCFVAWALAASLPAMAQPRGERGPQARAEARGHPGRAPAVQSPRALHAPRSGYAPQVVHSPRGGYAPRGVHAPRGYYPPRVVVGPPVYYGPRVIHSPPVYYGPRVIYSAPLFYPPVIYSAPIVYGPRVSPPVVYVERDDLPPQPQLQAVPADDPSAWWYFCTDSNTYYPYVTECASPWQRVVPTPPSAANPAR